MPELPARDARSTLVAELRQRRIAAGLSQAELAERAGYSREYVSRAERPHRSLCSTDLMRALDGVLAAGGSLVALHDAAQQEKHRRRTDAALRARQPRDASPLVDVGVVAQVPAAVAGAQNPHCAATPDATAGSARLLAMLAVTELDPLTLDDIDDRVRALASSYFGSPPTTFLTTAGLLRDRVAQLSGPSYRPGTRRRLFAALATLTALMAEASFAASGPTDLHCSAALALAEEAGHGELIAWIRGTQAQIALHTGNPVAAGRYAQAGIAAAAPGTTAHVRSASYLARSAARRGDREEALDAWELAMRSWDHLPTTSPESILSLSADYPAYCELTLRAWLGDTTRAKVVIDHQSDTDRPPSPSTARAITQIDTALVRVLDGEIDEAIACGDRALMLGAARRTPPLRDRLTDLAHALAPVRHRPARELVGRMTWTSV